MLKVNRLLVEINTENGVYGIDTCFNSGLNFIASEDNTCGKSSILSSIYYCLGLEEIIGGRGEKVLTSVYKTTIEDGEKSWNVLESGAYLEISNGEEIVTIYRSAKSLTRDSKLMTLFYSSLDSISNQATIYEDMYVHMPNSAIAVKGFHSFLEKFLHLDLPLVPTSDDSQRKLYLQLIFSAMFIEQKHGWGDIFAGMPILGIKDSKKRVLEFIMHLDTLDNEKKKESCRHLENSIALRWKGLINDVFRTANKETCSIIGWPSAPRILSDSDIARIYVYKNQSILKSYIDNLVEQYESTKQMKPKIIDNFEALQSELKETEDSISALESELSECRNSSFIEEGSIKAIENNLEIIKNDIRNNKDAARLRNLGSDISCLTSSDICPLCGQPIKDTLLPLENDMPIMSIDENIRHLEAQKDMLNFALNGHKQNKAKLDNYSKEIDGRIYSLRRLAKSIRSDLFSTNDEFSETIVLKRINLETEINNLLKLDSFIERSKNLLASLSNEWKAYLADKEKIPSKKFSDLDEEKICHLRSYFISNLRKFGYKSISNVNNVEISEETYLPIIEGFDMKFDSSASDNIRAIWAFTLAIMQTSMKKSGNHPCVLIFDEPDQHSIVTNDMEQFFKSIIDFGNTCQVLIGITIKDSDIKLAISQLPTDLYSIITVPTKAFKKIDNSPDKPID